MTYSNQVDVKELKSAASSLLDFNNYHNPAELIEKTESQEALEILHTDAVKLANDPNFMQNQWLLNQHLDGFPHVKINDDRSITLTAGLPDGAREIVAKPHEIDISDSYGGQGSHTTTTLTGRRTY